MLKINLILLIVLFISAQSLADKCLFRDNCGEFDTAFGNFPIPCILDEKDSQPKQFANKSTEVVLKKFTPELFKDPNPVFCCNDEQVHDIMEQMNMAKGFMNRCPSCFVNFAKIFFHMTCSPNHSEYLIITNHTKSTIHPEKQMLTELTYYMTQTFATNVYNSCSNVKFPSGDSTIMTLFCGGKNPCTPQYFLDYIGKKDPSPFQIDFHLVNDIIEEQGMTPMNVEAISCANAPKGYSNNSCSCVDCPQKCSVKPYPPNDEPRFG